MDVVFHIGAHFTDRELLIKTLRRNREPLAELGVAVPDPAAYRRPLGEAVARLRGAAPDAETAHMFRDLMGITDTTRRVILSNESFISMASKAVEDGQFYPKAFKAGWLRALFPETTVAFALGLRDPAGLLAALYKKRAQDSQDFPDFLGGLTPTDPLWSDYVTRLRSAAPDAPILIWCNEDTPLIWPDIIRRIGGLAPGAPVAGALDVAAQVLSKEGKKRLASFLVEHPPATASAHRRVLAAFLDKYAEPEAMEDEIDLPGWTENDVENVAAAYDADVERIRSIRGVDVLLP
ncbi:MAG: hypothetical protein AAFR35_16760 [Pseudomonadota bacterium]